MKTRTPQNEQMHGKDMDHTRPASVKQMDASQGDDACPAAADHETQAFQADLMEAVRDMKAGRAARITHGTSAA